MSRSTLPADQPATPSNRSTRSGSRGVAVAYFALALVGLVGTWYFNLSYDGQNYLADWFANPASSSAAVDIITIVGVASVVYVREGRRLGWRLPVILLFIPLSIIVAVAFALPLFLGLRELATARRSRPAREAAESSGYRYQP